MSADIRALIEEYDGEAKDVATAVTLQIMSDKKHRNVVQDIVMGYVRQQVTQHRRSESRRIEDRAFAHGDPFEVAVNELPTYNPMATRLELLREKFFCPHCTQYVTWGEATLSCHNGRRDYMLKLASAVIQDAERHKAAIEQLTQHKVRNLNELERKVLSVR